MLEVITEAIVLDKENLGEQDSRVFLYTKDFGKIAAKATSLRKIVSKLAAHLEPLNYVTARLLSRGDFLNGASFHLADALVIDSANDYKNDNDRLKRIIPILDLISKSIPYGSVDQELWDFLLALRTKEVEPNLTQVFKILGFDPVFASCELCQKIKPEYFFPKNNFFVCQFCRLNSKEEKKQFIEIGLV